MKPDRVSCIDFEPTEIAEILDSEGEVVIRCPFQPCYSERSGQIGEFVPLYGCSIHIPNGTIERNVAALPHTAETLYVDYAGGGRGSFLPRDFAVSGRVTLRFLNEADEPEIVVTGDAFVLKAERTEHEIELEQDAT